MADTKVFSFPENNGGGGYNDVAAMNNMWNNPIWAIVFLSALNGNNMFGGRNGNNANVDFVTSQLGNAIAGNANAISNLSTQLNCSEGQIQNAINNIMASINSLSSNMGLSFQALTSTVTSGNMSLANQLCQCCCENRTAILEQTNALQNSINGVGQQVAAKAAADQLAMCQQTYALTDTFNRGYLALDNKIDALESNRKDREITALTAKLAQVESQQFTVGAIQQAVAPILGQLSAIGGEVEAIKRCQPPTITLPNNQYTAVPTLFANAGADFIASYWANRLSSATSGATTPTTPTSTVNSK